MKDFMLGKYLQGFKVIGINYKKIERHALLKENQKKYQAFKQQLDLSMLHEYFKLGIEAEIFIETRCTNCGMVGIARNQPCWQCRCPTHLVRTKQEGEDLFFEFDHEGYNYKFRRQNITPVLPKNPIYNKLKNINALKRKFQTFVRNMNFNPIIDFFEMGIEARAFTDNRTGKLLSKNDVLMGADQKDKNYLYTFMRQRLLPPEKPKTLKDAITVSPPRMFFHDKPREYFDEAGHPIDKETYDDIGKEQLKKILKSKDEDL